MVNSYFTKRFETPHGLLNFYFNRINTADGVRFHVSCADHQKTYMFLMVEVLEQWYITDDKSVPDWLLHMQKQLSGLIAENMHY